MIIHNATADAIRTARINKALGVIESRCRPLRSDLKQITICRLGTSEFKMLEQRHNLPAPAGNFGLAFRFEHTILIFKNVPDDATLMNALFRARVLGFPPDNWRFRALIWRLQHHVYAAQ